MQSLCVLFICVSQPDTSTIINSSVLRWTFQPWRVLHSALFNVRFCRLVFVSHFNFRPMPSMPMLCIIQLTNRRGYVEVLSCYHQQHSNEVNSCLMSWLFHLWGVSGRPSRIHDRPAWLERPSRIHDRPVWRSHRLDVGVLPSCIVCGSGQVMFVLVLDNWCNTPHSLLHLIVFDLLHSSVFEFVTFPALKLRSGIICRWLC